MNLLMTDDELDSIDAMNDAELGRCVRVHVERYRAKLDAGRPAAEDRAFTVDAECALRAAAEQRNAAEHARDTSPLGRLIPGYGRLA